MVWVVILVIIVVLALFIPNFWKILIVPFAVLACVGLVLYVNVQREERLSKKLIPANEVVLSDLSLHYEYSYSWKLTGRIKNNSKKYNLINYTIKIKMKDCDKNGDCEVVGENTVDCVDIIVPPEQSRKIDSYVYFSGLDQKARRKYEWEYSVVVIKGSKPYEANK